MALEQTGNVQNTATILEHDNTTDAKKVVEVGGIIPRVYDRLIGTNEDANGNPQLYTVKYKGATVGTVNITWNSSSNITDIYWTAA